MFRVLSANYTDWVLNSSRPIPSDTVGRTPILDRTLGAEYSSSNINSKSDFLKIQDEVYFSDFIFLRVVGG